MKFLILLMSVNAFAMDLKVQGGEVDFLAYTKPGFIKIAGKGAPAEGQVSADKDKVQGLIHFTLSSLDTGIGRRNEHMNKYLETDKFPRAELKLESAKLDKPFDKLHPSMNMTDFKGQLSLHGVTQPVSGNFTVDDKGKVDAHFKVKLSDFKIEKPSFAGITVTDEVDVEVKIDQLL